MCTSSFSTNVSFVPPRTHFRFLSHLQQTSSAESTYEELPPSRSSINAPLVNNDNWQQHTGITTGVSFGLVATGTLSGQVSVPFSRGGGSLGTDCVCNTATVARIFATLISGGFCGWRLYLFIVFTFFRGWRQPDLWNAVMLVEILGSLCAFIAGCLMTCGKKVCCCKCSISTFTTVQVIGAAACILMEFGAMIDNAVLCKNYNSSAPPGYANQTNGCDAGFYETYWNDWQGNVNFPICAVLLICTCISKCKIIKSA